MERKYALIKDSISNLLSDEEMKLIPTMQEELIKIVINKQSELIKKVIEIYLQRPINESDYEKIAVQTEANESTKSRSVLTYDSEVLGVLNSYTEFKGDQAFHTVEFIPRGRRPNEPVLDPPPQPCQGCGS